MTMHRFVSFNCSPVESSKPTVGGLAAGALYGKGVFTTIAIFDWIPFLWEKHWRRLEANAALVGIDLSEFHPAEAVIVTALEELFGDNKFSTGRARITLFDESATVLWPYEATRRTSLLITTADLRPVAKDFKLTISPHLINSTSPLAGVKSCNYLEKIIAKDEAKQLGFDEAIQLNERGEITSACTANVFWSRDGKLFTPSLATGCLPGTTREFILENMDCEEVESGIEELQTADEIFLTSAGIGVVQVAEFEGRTLQRNEHAIMKLVPSRQ
jgi:branched-chain amino acid aminotransferase